MAGEPHHQPQKDEPLTIVTAWSKGSGVFFGQRILDVASAVAEKVERASLVCRRTRERGKRKR